MNHYATTQRQRRLPLGRLVMLPSLAAMAALLLLVPLTTGVAGAGEPAGAPPSIYEARAEAAALADTFQVPAQIDTFTPYSLSETASGSSHGLQSVFYPGFLLSAAAFQQGFPPPPGTTETLYPQGPVDGKASVFPIPGGAGSSGSSGPAASKGEAHYGSMGSADGGGTMGLSKTSVSAQTATVRSTADVVLNQIRLSGGLIIGSIVATAEATADGTTGGAHNTGSVTLNGLTLSGVPLTLSPDQLQAGGQKTGVPGPEGVNPALAAAGITIRRLPDSRVTAADGSESRLELGGYEIRIDQPGREFHARYVLGHVSVLARAVRDGASAG
jgi:hypothetical protein